MKSENMLMFEEKVLVFLHLTIGLWVGGGNEQLTGQHCKGNNRGVPAVCRLEP